MEEQIGQKDVIWGRYELKDMNDGSRSRMTGGKGTRWAMGLSGNPFCSEWE